MLDKNRKKEINKLKRVYFDMNLGVRTHKDKKHPNRGERRKNLRKMLDNIE